MKGPFDFRKSNIGFRKTKNRDILSKKLKIPKNSPFQKFEDVALKSRIARDRDPFFRDLSLPRRVASSFSAIIIWSQNRVKFWPNLTLKKTRCCVVKSEKAPCRGLFASKILDFWPYIIKYPKRARVGPFSANFYFSKNLMMWTRRR